MKVFQTAIELKKFLQETNIEENNAIGFVPTMGALHEGHLSLVRKSKEKCNITIVSIFVNPTQFNDKKDFDRYPIQIDTDLEMLLSVNCDVVFIPNVDEIYSSGVEEPKLEINLGFLGTTLEAERRPGHYEGVVQVVKKLLDIVCPNILFLGQKDYQQCMVIQKLIDVFNIKTRIEIVETKREADGLAMSSRNMRLKNEEREIAPKLYQALKNIEGSFKSANINSLIETQIQWLNADKLITVEYLAVVNGNSLENIAEYNSQTPITVLIAAKIGEIRLIDNLILN